MVENVIFLQTPPNSRQQTPAIKSHNHQNTASPTTPKIKIIQNTKTQIKPRKKKSYSGQIERRRKRGRTIGFGVRPSRSGTTNRCCDCGDQGRRIWVRDRGRRRVRFEWRRRDLAIDASRDRAVDRDQRRGQDRDLATARDRAVNRDLGRRRDRDQLRDLATARSREGEIAPSIAIFAASDWSSRDRRCLELGVHR